MSLDRTIAERFLIWAPTGADARNIGAVLATGGIHHRLCSDGSDLCAGIDEGAAALIITEEAIGPTERELLMAALERQPAWSDIPLVLIASARTMEWWTAAGSQRLGDRANVSLIERPLRGSMLLAAARSVSRARQRQYEIRDLLLERDGLLHTLEARVTERTAKLQELVAELEAFSYSVSHDLRAPLRVMAGYAQAIMDDHEATLGPDVKNYVMRIAHTAERMDRLTQDVLAYTRVSRADIALEPIALDTLLQNLIDEYPTLTAAKASIRIKRPLLAVQGHGPSLIQALSNLIENAIKFVPADRVARVDVSTRREGDRVRIMIKDNGVGIAAAHHQQIFGIFERVVPKSVPGTGIGLAIVKKAVERMGGTVGLSSREGKGSEFWLELPRATVPMRKRRRSG